MDHAKEQSIAQQAWDATKRDDQPGFDACASSWKENLFAKVKSVELHGPLEGDAFEEKAAELLAAPGVDEAPPVTDEETPVADDQEPESPKRKRK